MNIPLDNLYHWVRGCANEPVSIYIFRPYGSKNIVDLGLFSILDANVIAPEIVCHDQEPLDYATHQSVDIHKLWLHLKKSIPALPGNDLEMQSLVPHYCNLNFYAWLRALGYRSIFDRYILLHSEKNSADVEKFSQTAETVYYWSHGIIARDWYRFAQHDPRLRAATDCKKTFLIYCRAWTGTREYRIKFLELLIEKKLISQCQTSVLHQDQESELCSYVCKDSDLQPSNAQQLISIPHNLNASDASADYCADDFLSTDISVVLETVAADTKIHLTEKTLRPIACGHPFMLLAGPGALEYLRSYGFKTFGPWIDESYDQEPDINQRMHMITREMQRIANLSCSQRTRLIDQLKKITRHNKKHFFSDKFFNQIQSELTENLNASIKKVKFTRGSHYLAHQKLTRAYRNLSNNVLIQLRKYTVSKVLRRLRYDPSTSLTQTTNQHPEVKYLPFD